MSQMGNIETVVLLIEGCGAIDATCVTHRTSMTSLEDIKINFHNNAMRCTTLTMTDFFSFCFFNRDLKPYRKSIYQCFQCLLAEKNYGNSYRIF